MIVTDIPTAVSPAEQERLQQLARDGLVLELGSHFGASTVAMAQTARRVHAVDWHRGDGHAGNGDSVHEFFANLDRYGVRDKVVAHVVRFEDVLPLFRPQMFDLAFIDGFHEEGAVLADARTVLPLMIPGGHIAFHDYAGHPNFGVEAAVNRFAERLGVHLDVVESMAVLEVPAC